MKIQTARKSAGGAKFWGAHAPSRVVFDALVENPVEWPETPVFGEGAKDNTRGRVCSPWLLRNRPTRDIEFDEKIVVPNARIKIELRISA